MRIQDNECDVCSNVASCAMINKDGSLRYSCLDQNHITEVWNRVKQTRQ